ncbi:MAG: hypothetical protein EPN85_12460 [Bacteroidetes bacterium]|nr:MAG: hypothetical protein EPN85_12460 [Bacteroidota bacterium]
MKEIHLIVVLLLIISNTHGQSVPTPLEDSLKTLKAIRITSAPKIDGLLDEEVWKNAEAASDFIQNSPIEGAKPSQRTEIKIIYDNYAIYVGATMYDSAPDSILHELGNRDDNGLNADNFRFVIDPYNTRQDGYVFGVFASGVQFDGRFSDETYNAVWQSSVKITDKGWTAELKIPYSAIRFPNTKEQKWGLELTRNIQRKNEFVQWALTPAGKANFMKYWGTLLGISDIEPPLRLSLTPYLSSYFEKAPGYNADGTYNYANSFSYNGGADIKYGLDERFTLDMTLLPDFGQVQSDNKVKNLSYREINYEDNRPFFKEGTDLFNKDGLFYSRRIGKTPTLFYSVEDSLQTEEKVEKNPSQAKLLNATKLSGRTNKGMGIGVFNAITGNTYAEIKDSMGNTRRILTEPLTNYNSFVFDQQLKNSSNIFLINTNVMRNGSNDRDANVTGTGFMFQNKKNTWAIFGSSDLSQVFTHNDSLPENFNNQMGFFYGAGISKISGKWQYGIYREAMNSTFDRTDMGYYATVDYSSTSLNFAYFQFKPWKSVLRSQQHLNINYGDNYTTKKRTDLSANLNSNILFKNYIGIFYGGGVSPVSSYDYYEPRVPGRYLRTYEYYYAYCGFNTDNRKKFTLGINLNTSNWFKSNIQHFSAKPGYTIGLNPRFRASDKLSFHYSFNYSLDPFNVGFANFDTTNNIIFGGRRLITYENTFTTKYIFKNDLSLSINARHYWITGDYKKYYTLLDNGLLEPNPNYTVNNNFSYNVFNIDAVFSWQFSPGSVFSVVYKNAIEKGDQIILRNFSHNLDNTLQSPQTNSISLKVLYYLDYQQMKRKRTKP